MLVTSDVTRRVTGRGAGHGPAVGAPQRRARGVAGEVGPLGLAAEEGGAHPGCRGSTASPARAAGVSGENQNSARRGKPSGKPPSGVKLAMRSGGVGGMLAGTPVLGMRASVASAPWAR